MGHTPSRGMNRFAMRLARLLKADAGQGLVEYVLLLAIVGFGAVAGMGSLASGVNSAFTKVASIFGQYIT